MKRITILGTGFAALTAIRHLRKQDSTAQITVIAPTSQFVYAPSLIWIPTELRSAGDLTVDLTHFFQRNNITYLQDRACGLSDGGRTVLTEQGSVTNDALLIACGSQYLKKLPGIEHALTICEGVASAKAIAERLKNMTSGTIALGFSGNPNEAQAMRGGPMFEMMFGIDTWLRRNNKRQDIQMKFFCPAPKPGIRLGEKAFAKILDEMHRRDIEPIALGEKIKGFSASQVTTEATTFDADLILFMPGLTGQPWFQDAHLPLSAGGLIQADEYTRVPGFDKVYALGDCASYDLPDWTPKQAHMADLQAAAAASNVLAELSGKVPSKTFRPELMCIIDTLDKGIMVFRSEKRKIVLDSKWFHLAKRFFEWMYLRKYR